MNLNWSKFAVASLLGGIVYFLLGWLVYGFLLQGMMTMPEGIEVPEDQMNILYMVLSCLFFAALITYVAMRIGLSTWQSGAVLAIVMGVLMSLSLGLGQAAMYTFGSLSNTFYDVIGNAICGGAAGAVIGWWLGRK